MSGRHDAFWELRRGGPHGPKAEIFKCVHCGSETMPGNGFNGEPSRHNCHPGCPCHTDAKGHEPSSAFARGMERMAAVECGVAGCTLAATAYCLHRCPEKKAGRQKGERADADPGDSSDRPAAA
mgnify:CR=1 FL=1